MLDLFPKWANIPNGLAWDGTNLYCVDNTGDELWLIDRTTPANSTLVGAFPSGLTTPLGLAWVPDPVAPVVLTGQDTSIEIDLSQGTLRVGSITPPLTLADYTVPTGYETVVLALIEAERSGQDFLFRTDGTPFGTLSDGELAIDDLDATISRIRDRAGDGSTLQLNSEGADDIGVAFSTGGSYAGGIWDIQTADDSFSLDLNVLTFGNATQVRYAVPAAGQSVLAGIATGDLFIIALRIPEAADPVVLTGQEITVEIDLSRGTLNVGEIPPVSPVVLSGQEIEHRDRPFPGDTERRRSSSCCARRPHRLKRPASRST